MKLAHRFPPNGWFLQTWSFLSLNSWGTALMISSVTRYDIVQDGMEPSRGPSSPSARASWEASEWFLGLRAGPSQLEWQGPGTIPWFPVWDLPRFWGWETAQSEPVHYLTCFPQGQSISSAVGTDSPELSCHLPFAGQFVTYQLQTEFALFSLMVA
jgi:hypothetical protein